MHVNAALRRLEGKSTKRNAFAHLASGKKCLSERLGFKRDTLAPKNDLHLEKSRTNVQGKEFLISPNLCLILKKRRVIQTKMSHFTTKMLKISILACFLRFERKEICFNLQNVQLSRNNVQL